MSTLPGASYHPHISLRFSHFPRAKLTTKFVIAANARMNIKYALVRDTLTSELNVLEESVPERISKRSVLAFSRSTPTVGSNLIYVVRCE